MHFLASFWFTASHVDSFPPQELAEENRILSRELRRREIELDRLTDTTGDLPTILRAHNEEVRALKHKLKQVSECGGDFVAEFSY